MDHGIPEVQFNEDEADVEDEIPVPKKYRGPTKLCIVPKDKINVK